MSQTSAYAQNNQLTTQMAAQIPQETLQKWMDECVDLAYQNVVKGGKPFAAVIYDSEGKKVADGVNEVVWTSDPTSHAEINAIRAATRTRGSTQLSDCYMVMSGESCPMCYTAIMMTNLKECYYCFSGEEETAIGLDTTEWYKQLALPNSQRTISLRHLSSSSLERDPFAMWDKMHNHVDEE